MLSSSSATYRFTDGGGERRPVWLMISILANLILAGLIVAWVMNVPARNNPNWRENLVATLGPADAAVLRDYLPRFDAARQKANGLAAVENEKLLGVLRAETFDPAAFQATMEEMTAIRDRQDAETHPIFLKEIGALTPEGRRRVAAAVQIYGPGGTNERKR